MIKSRGWRHHLISQWKSLRGCFSKIFNNEKESNRKLFDDDIGNYRKDCDDEDDKASVLKMDVLRRISKTPWLHHQHHHLKRWTKRWGHRDISSNSIVFLSVGWKLQTQHGIYGNLSDQSLLITFSQEGMLEGKVTKRINKFQVLMV